MTLSTPGSTLKSYMLKKQETSKAFSLRYLARKMEMSPSYLSAIFLDKRAVPPGKIDDFAKELEIDSVGVRNLKKLILVDQSLSEEAVEFIEKIQEEKLSEPLSSSKYKVVEDVYRELMTEWYYVPLLLLLDHPNFVADSVWISDRLGLKEEVAQSAWQKLIDLSVVYAKDGQWYRNKDRMRMSNCKPMKTIQNWHSQMMDKAQEELAKDDIDSWGNRFINGATISVSQKDVDKIKNYVEEVIYKAQDMADSNEDQKDKIYQLAVQFFPLTK